MTILDINPIYDNEFETDHLMTHEEYILKIGGMSINSKQYERLNNALKYTRDKIEKVRKEALTIPTFSSKDFHAVDKFVVKINMFLSSYSWLCQEVTKPDISNKLKRKLIDILNIAEENPFPNNFLDRIKNWQRRKSFEIKREYKKYRRQTKEKSDLPFSS